MISFVMTSLVNVFVRRASLEELVISVSLVTTVSLNVFRVTAMDTLILAPTIMAFVSIAATTLLVTTAKCKLLQRFHSN